MTAHGVLYVTRFGAGQDKYAPWLSQRLSHLALQTLHVVHVRTVEDTGAHVIHDMLTLEEARQYVLIACLPASLLPAYYDDPVRIVGFARALRYFYLRRHSL